MNITMSDDIRHEINHNNNMSDGPAIVSRIFYSILQAPFTSVSVQTAIALKNGYCIKLSGIFSVCFSGFLFGTHCESQQTY